MHESVVLKYTDKLKKFIDNVEAYDLTVTMPTCTPSHSSLVAGTLNWDLIYE